MRTPCNPCTWYGNSGNTATKFTYEGGSKLFYFAPGVEIDEKTFRAWIPISVMFFANDKKHAVDIIKRMLELRIETSEQHEIYLKGKDYSKTCYQPVPKLLLDNIDKWIITEAPTDQFYKVGWASNDTIL